MGARTTRITREEFLTPPEFLHVPQTQHPDARVGGVRIELVRTPDAESGAANGVTRLGGRFQQIPLRFFPPHALKNEPASLLYLISPTAGLLDGDAHLYEVAARRGTRAVVTGQSATRIHPALVSFATQQWSAAVEDDAVLVVLPGPAIPYKGSRYYQRARVELAPTARLIWGDVWLPGRYDRGALSERFVFDRIVQDMEVRRDGRLIYRDRFRWDGPWTEEQARWHFGPGLAAASLLVAGPLPDGFPLPGPPADVLRAVLPLEDGSTAIRWCGAPTAVTGDLANLALRIAGVWTDGPGAPPWFLESSGLAPNHWFSTPIAGS